jgi:hypothetical protein
MLASIALAGLALRAGLRLRRRRVARARRPKDLLHAHLVLAKPAVILVGVGFLAGPVSAYWLRGWTPFGTFHAWLGLLAAGLFATAALLGRRLERGRGRPVEAHAIAGGLAFLVAAVAAVAGFVLLP